MQPLSDVLQQKFDKLDANGDGKLSYEECLALLPESSVNKRLLEKLFKMADASGDGFIQENEFEGFYKLVTGGKGKGKPKGKKLKKMKMKGKVSLISIDFHFYIIINRRRSLQIENKRRQRIF